MSVERDAFGADEVAFELIGEEFSQSGAICRETDFVPIRL